MAKRAYKLTFLTITFPLNLHFLIFIVYLFVSKCKNRINSSIYIHVLVKYNLRIIRTQFNEST